MEPRRNICRLRYEGERPEDDCIFILGDRAVTLGRSPESDLVLNHESVSRAHARFSREGDTWMIVDLESKNGVRVNTYRIEEQKLRNGDRIDLGTARLYVEIGPDVPQATRANVVFSADDEPSLHTEILEMSGLSNLLSVEPGASGSAEPAESPSLSESLQLVGDAGSQDSGSLLRLVSDATEMLISCDSLDQTLDRILALVFSNLPAERGLICLYDEATDETTPKVMRTLDGVPEEPIHISSNITRHVLERKQSLLVKDTQMDERFGSAESVIMMQIHSAICAPLYRDGRVAGFIYVDRQSSSEPFDTPHLHALSALAMLSAVAVETASLRDHIRHEQEMRARLARYSSPAVVERILQAPGGAEQGMVADEHDVTVLFADLTGFTGMAENMRSADVIRILNRVFERLTDVVFRHDGTLDKFRGDGMMAFFGAPLPMADHAERAVRAALEMQSALAELNASSAVMSDLRMRIGINSGAVVVGDIGSPQRKDYTVIGDVVNTASRLESSVAQPGQVVIGRATFERIDQHFEVRTLEEVRVKGKQQTVHPYLVVRTLD
ncbi:MAG: FHA domain-containing protein [Deltaproteobacteria bacterium]|nr:FHA domain-containing protein [Deltaproteobacteria bacterium]MBW2382940.1 FHA domain-containing protein [Deltaproteobacteria bacterium]